MHASCPIQAASHRLDTALCSIEQNGLRQHEIRETAAGLLLRLQDANAPGVHRLQEAGIMIFSDVVDGEVGWSKNPTRGVDALFTNDPAALIGFINKSSKAR